MTMDEGIDEDEEILPARTILATLLSTIALGGLLSAAAYGLVLFFELTLRFQCSVPERELPSSRERVDRRADLVDPPHPRSSLLE